MRGMKCNEKWNKKKFPSWINLEEFHSDFTRWKSFDFYESLCQSRERAFIGVPYKILCCYLWFYWAFARAEEVEKKEA